MFSKQVITVEFRIYKKECDFIKRYKLEIDYKLFFSIFILTLCPTIYTTLRIFFLGQMPGDWSYSIAGQLSWVNLIYEILHEAIILPITYFLGQSISNKHEFENRIKTGLIISFSLYSILSFTIILFTEHLLRLMAVSPSIINESAIYIQIESIAKIFSILYQFLLVVLFIIGKSKSVYILTLSQLLFSIITDTFLTSTLPFSMNLGVNGIGYSNIITNCFLTVIALILLKTENINVCQIKPLSFAWCKDFIKIGSLSGFESFIRNIAYMIMIIRMVNVVSEQGIYWIANNFIWGWLLLPISALTELIKKDTALNKRCKNIKTYFIFTGIICVIWIISVPLWKPFMKNILMIPETNKVYHLVLILLGFYVLYAFQNIFDSIFYGAGKTQYMLAESVITNTIYYGGAFIAYLLELWEPTLNSITLLFGIGIAFDSIVSFIAYKIYLKHNESNIM